MRPPLPPKHGFSIPSLDENSEKSLNDTESLPQWNDYFDHQYDMRIEGTDNAFRIYSAGNTGPLVVLLHGGGHSSLSWALVAKSLKNYVRVMAYDFRGHGRSNCKEESDLSADTLTTDGINVIQQYCSGIGCGNNEKINGITDNSDIPLILVGHSLGGAIAIRMAASSLLKNLKVLIVLDVVEGIAMESLPHMKSFIAKFPSSFPSRNNAIEWALRANILANRESAEISIPSQLVQSEQGLWVWKVDLAKTQQFWEGWFKGISKLFLSTKAVKVLICAGNDRLDKELMIAHMQGKFQFEIIPQTGHIIEEDQPERVAGIIAFIIKRYGISNENIPEPLSSYATKINA